MIDDPVPAQTGAQGAAAGIETVLFQLTGGVGVRQWIAWHPRPKRDKSLALADQTPTISATTGEDEIAIIPWQELEPDTLTNLLEHFVLQEGTEYGEQDVSPDRARSKRSGNNCYKVAPLVYSELHESVNVVPKTH